MLQQQSSQIGHPISGGVRPDIPAEWTRTSGKDTLYTTDAVINAFVTGHKEGLEHRDKARYNQLKQNIELVAGETAGVINYLTERKFSPISFYVKVEAWDTFVVLITLPEKDILNPQYNYAYDHVSSIEERLNNDSFDITFHLYGLDGGKFNETMLEADGFVFKHSLAS